MTFKLILSLISVTIFHLQSLAQTSKFDSIYNHTSQVLVGTSPEKALANTAYLYTIAKNDTERMNICILKGKLLKQYDINDEAIKTLLQADSLATSSADYFMLARINGLISTIYRETGIASVGKAYLQKAKNASKKIEDKNNMYRFQNNLCQEMSYYHLADKKYKQAIYEVLKGNQYLAKINSGLDKNFHYAVNSELIAKSYLLLHQKDSALFFYNLSQQQLSISKSSESPLKGFIYNGLGNVYTSVGDYKNALLNYQKAEKIAETSNFYNLRFEVYSDLLNYYKKLNNNQKYIHYNELYLKLIETEHEDRKVIADNIIVSLQAKEKVNQSKYQQTYVIIISICFIVFLILLCLFIYKRKQDNKKIINFISSRDHSSENISVTEIVKVNDTNSIQCNDATKDYMSLDTEKTILKSINNFELSKYYLDKSISINFVAAELGINHRYLSYVINKHKEKDFNSYINELRINYIVEKMRKDPNFMKYKISYLAEQCGFSSHSRFTVTFKKVTGVSPTTFITYLKENPHLV